MTQPSLREYAAIQRERYLQARRAEKSRLLDEVVTVTGLHRKAAIRLLRRPARASPARPRSGRPRLYGPALAAPAQVLWEAVGRIGPQRLHPFVPELLDRLSQCGELALAPDVEKLLRQASPATLGRLLAPARAPFPPRGASTTRPGMWLKGQIPIRTFTEWEDARPGFLEADLVAHCGTSTEGFSLCTLCAVDIATAWVELEAVWGKGQQRVGAAVHHVRQRLPMPLLGLDSIRTAKLLFFRLPADSRFTTVPQALEPQSHKELRPCPQHVEFGPPKSGVRLRHTPFKRGDLLSRITPHEAAAILRVLLKRHSELHGEAEEVAKAMVTNVQVEEVAEPWQFRTHLILAAAHLALLSHVVHRCLSLFGASARSLKLRVPPCLPA